MPRGNEAYASAEMLIRKPVKEVFEAFINPAITKNFWFTRASGPLEVGTKVLWEWEMYGISIPVTVQQILPHEKIAFQWDEPAKTVVFKFQSLSETSTYVTVTEEGYTQQGDALIAAVRGSTGGFTTVLDGLKAFLEHGISLNLIADKFPLAVTSHGQ